MSKISKYNECRKRIDEIKQWRGEGKNVELISQKLGVAAKTFFVWLKTKQDIREAYADGNELLIERLEKTVYERAMGRMKVKKVVKKELTRKGKPYLESIVTTETEVLPSERLLMWVLTNINPSKWKSSSSQIDSTPEKKTVIVNEPVDVDSMDENFEFWTDA